MFDHIFINRNNQPFYLDSTTINKKSFFPLRVAIATFNASNFLI